MGNMASQKLYINVPTWEVFKDQRQIVVDILISEVKWKKMENFYKQLYLV